MNEFLNKFNLKKRNVDQKTREKYAMAFTQSVSFLKNAIGKKVFRPEGVFNVSVFESILVGVSELFDKGDSIDVDHFKKNFDSLLKDEEYRNAISRATSDESVFKIRQKLTLDHLNR
jgi:hypothetical protein